MTTRLAALALAVAFYGASPARAAFFDVAADFSLAGNPNGVWSYGTTPTVGGGFTLDTLATASRNGVDYWSVPGGLPAAFHNRTNQVVVTGTPVLQPGQFGLHPGPNNELSVVRFTAPVAGGYDLSSAFVGADTVGTTTDVHVLVNGSQIFGGFVRGFGAGSGPSFSRTLALAAGDTVDFAVGFGDNGYSFDSTGLAVTLGGPGGAAAVPEPASLSLLAAGGLGLLGHARRRRASA